MQTVTVQNLYHRNQHCIAIHFIRTSEIQNLIHKVLLARWTKTHNCWYLPLSKENYERLVAIVSPITSINATGLVLDISTIPLNQTSKKVLPSAKIKTNSTTIKRVATPAKIENELPKLLPISLDVSKAILPINAHVLPAMHEKLILKAYSPSTVKTYMGEMKQLLQTLGNFDADRLSQDQMKRYLVHCHKTLALTENTLHSRMNAMKFYYEQVLKKEKFFWEIPRPKKPTILPKLLNEIELTRLFNALINKKHKAMLFTEIGRAHV